MDTTLDEINKKLDIIVEKYTDMEERLKNVEEIATKMNQHTWILETMGNFIKKPFLSWRSFKLNSIE